MRRRMLLGAALAGAGATPALAAGTARAADPGPSVTRTGTTTLDSQAIFFVSYDGLVNNNAFQKNGLLTYKGHQYAAWYTADRGAVVGRHALGGGTWSTLEVGRDGLTLTSRFTYPQFVATPEGRLQLSYRAGVSGNGRKSSGTTPSALHVVDFALPA